MTLLLTFPSLYSLLSFLSVLYTEPMKDECISQASHPLYFANLLVAEGYADGTVAGEYN